MPPPNYLLESMEPPLQTIKWTIVLVLVILILIIFMAPELVPQEAVEVKVPGIPVMHIQEQVVDGIFVPAEKVLQLHDKNPLMKPVVMLLVLTLIQILLQALNIE